MGKEFYKAVICSVPVFDRWLARTPDTCHVPKPGRFDPADQERLSGRTEEHTALMVRINIRFNDLI